MNRIILVGRLVRDPELRKTSTDKSVTSFTVAVNRKTKDQDGNNITDFINCVSWNKLADTIFKYFNKGQEIALEGSLQINQYTNKDGENRYSTNILVDNITFIGSKKEQEQTKQTEQQFDQEDINDLEFSDDDLPF